MKLMNVGQAPVVAKAKAHNKVAKAPQTQQAPLVGKTKTKNKLNVHA